MRRDILLLGTAREQSTRVKDKMTRPFAGTSLFEAYLRNLHELWMSGRFSSRGVAVARSDETLWRAATASGVPVIERSEQSAAPEIQPRGRELHFLSGFGESHVLYFNACVPLFPLRWIVNAVDIFLTRPEIVSMTSTRVVHDWFWTRDGVPINNSDPRCLSTQGCEPIYRSVHAWNIYPRQRMLDENVRWGHAKNDPLVMQYGEGGDEFADVDSEDDFWDCEQKWARREDARP